MKWVNVPFCLSSSFSFLKMMFVDAALFPQSNTGHFLWIGHGVAYSYYITTFLLHHLTACIRDCVGVFFFLFLNLEAEKR